MAPPQVRWDLSSLFSSPEDPRIDETWVEAHRHADALAQEFRGKLIDPNLTAATLKSALERLEALAQLMAKPATYANLLFAGDTASEEIGAFLQEQTEKASEVQVKILFLELELQQAPAETIERLLADPILADYVHYIRQARKMSPYRLSEKEEVLLEEVANVSTRAWVRLFEDITSNHVFRYQEPGVDEIQELSQEEVLDKLYDPNREVRAAGAAALTQGLSEIERTIVFIYNTLLLDKRIDDRLRKHPYAENSRHLENELDKETVDLVVGLCKERGDLVARYYRVKREILGLSELTHIDRYAPLFEAKSEVGWQEARQMVVDSFSRFHPEMGRRADEFFSRNWIDAEPRDAKMGGAFCSYITPDTHPVVMMSYLNKLRDVTTLAHELGHGVHGSLSRKQNYLNFHGTLPMAELASIFGEQTVFDTIIERADDRDRLALYAEKIEGAFASVYRQAAMFRFEQRCHEKRRTEGELAADEFGDIWQEELQSMFGDSVQLGEDHRKWWLYVWHFFGVPFYVYAYAFGELLSLSLYERARHEGRAFADKYIDVLSLGGSKTPQELMDLVGVDLKSKEFWVGGFAAIEKMIEEFERTWAGVKDSA